MDSRLLLLPVLLLFYLLLLLFYCFYQLGSTLRAFFAEGWRHKLYVYVNLLSHDLILVILNFKMMASRGRGPMLLY